MMIRKPQRLRNVTCPHASIFAAIAMIALAGVEGVQAITIGIDLGPSRVVTGTNPETSRIPFDGLNGTPVVGSVSVNFLFTNNEFVRLFTATQPLFDALIILQTNGSGLLGFLNGTGYLIDAHGNAIPGFGVTGSASGNNGSMSIGLFPLLKDKNGTPNDRLPRPLDFYGVHYDFTFPSNPSVEVTGGKFLLADNGSFTPFGIGPGHIPRDIVGLPDAGGTLLLLGIGLIGLIGMTIRVTSWPLSVFARCPKPVKKP
jgi:hypothetical protein